MNEPRLITGLSEIAGSYDALLCDAWGVIHNGRELFPGAAEALISFRKECGPVVVLTNAPRLSVVIPPQLDRLGLPREAYDAVVTSGDATRQVVAEMADRKFFRIGPSKDDGMFDAMEIEVVPLDKAEAIFCTGPNDDTRETPEDYRRVLTEAAGKNIPMVCANPDIVVKYGDRLIYCAGALGELYAALGGKVILGGKPHPPIYELARSHMSQSLGHSPKRILAIGDGLDTDIRGANEQGIDVVFVADGIFAEEAREGGKLAAHRLEAALAEKGVHAAFAMDTLAW
jgi:HAD superfamily hydrolase (TIGR01459 family)